MVEIWASTVRSSIHMIEKKRVFTLMQVRDIYHYRIMVLPYQLKIKMRTKGRVR